MQRERPGCASSRSASPSCRSSARGGCAPTAAAHSRSSRRDGWFTATLPRLPRVSARGGTVSEALAACGRLRMVALESRRGSGGAARRRRGGAPARARGRAVRAGRGAPRCERGGASCRGGRAAALATASSGCGSARRFHREDGLRGPSLERMDPAVTAGERVLAERAIAAAAEMGYAARVVIASGRAAARALARHGAFPRARAARTGGSSACRRRRPRRAVAGAAARGARARARNRERVSAGSGSTDAGALARLPAGTLAHRFGPDGVAAARLARGEDDTPLSPYAPETLPVEALELDAPAESAEPLLFALKRLADRVAVRLARPRPRARRGSRSS